jgi:hypothetical protein
VVADTFILDAGGIAPAVSKLTIPEPDNTPALRAFQAGSGIIYVLGATVYHDVFACSHPLTFKLRSNGFDGAKWTLEPTPGGEANSPRNVIKFTRGHLRLWATCESLTSLAWPTRCGRFTLRHDRRVQDHPRCSGNLLGGTLLPSQWHADIQVGQGTPVCGGRPPVNLRATGQGCGSRQAPGRRATRPVGPGSYAIAYLRQRDNPAQVNFGDLHRYRLGAIRSIRLSQNQWPCYYA